jgi:hypothetical protein
MPSIDVPEINPTTNRAPLDEFTGTLQLLFMGAETQTIPEQTHRVS